MKIQGLLDKCTRNYSILCLIFFAFFLLFPAYSSAFDTKGLQPLSPYGVFSTFSAESLNQNKIGIGIGFEKSGKPNLYRSIFQLSYGLHDRLEFNATVPYVRDREIGIDGLEDMSFGFKHRIMDEGKYNPAIAYILSVSVPSGREGFSTDGSIGAGLLITKKIGPFKGHVNAIYSNPDRSDLQDEYKLNVGAELAVSRDSDILAEIVGRKNYFKNKIDLLEWRLGYRIATTENIYTSIGAGFDIKNRTPDYRLMFSVSIILPKEKRVIQKIYEQ